MRRRTGVRRRRRPVHGQDDPARFFLDHARVALGDGSPFGTGYGSFVRLNFATSRTLLEQIVEAMAAAVRAAG